MQTDGHFKKFKINQSSESVHSKATWRVGRENLLNRTRDQIPIKFSQQCNRVLHHRLGHTSPAFPSSELNVN